MLLVPTELRASPIHGVGVFLVAPVKKGERVWSFDSRIDRIYTENDIKTLPEIVQRYLRIYSCCNDGRLNVLCGDNANYMNHGDTPNVLAFDNLGDNFAAFDLAIGVELTCDYRAIGCPAPS